MRETDFDRAIVHLKEACERLQNGRSRITGDSVECWRIRDLIGDAILKAATAVHAINDERKREERMQKKNSNKSASEWYWGTSGDGMFFGPFPTREEAVTEAVSSCHDDEPIYVGVGVPPDPISYLLDTTDLDWVLERMDEAAFDDGEGNPDDQTFYVIDTKEAKEAWDKMLREWGEKYIHSDWRHIPSPERVSDKERDAVKKFLNEKVMNDLNTPEDE